MLAAQACRVDPELREPAPPLRLAEEIPEGWPEPVYRFANNAISTKKFELGRALFYETKLSVNNEVSCGSCHQQEAAFAHIDHKLSHGIFSDKETKRNSPALFNLAWYPYFMHDGGINHIEVQPVAPITNPIEMGEDLNQVIGKLSADARYQELFKESFGTAEVTSERMLKAMAQFMALMYSHNSRYDQYKRGKATLTDAELRGYHIFTDPLKGNCASCHKEPLFTDFQFYNNGLAPNVHDLDSGRAVITREQHDMYKFKTPTLRNLVFTYPYMHDGRYGTIEECLDHYTDGIKNHTNLDGRLEYGLPLSAADKKDLLAFLLTLSDIEFLRDQKFADPNLTKAP